MSGTREQFGGGQSDAAQEEEECSRRKQNRDSGTGNREVCKCNVWSTVPSEPRREYSPSRGHLDLSTSMALHKLIVLTPDPSGGQVFCSGLFEYIVSNQREIINNRTLWVE